MAANALTNDHFDGRRFFNPRGLLMPSSAAIPKLMTEARARWPAHIDQPTTRPPVRENEAAVLTFIGQSTFLIQTAQGNVLTDPMYSERASPLSWIGPRRVRRPAVRFNDLPPISLVLLSHNHYDHCDRRTLRRLAKRFDPLVVTPLGNGKLVRSCGLRRVEELDWWEEAATTPMPMTLTPAHHFSARGLFDRNAALWGGFVFVTGERRLFFAGDTAYSSLFKDIRRRLGPIDLALLPIGAYAPRWFMQAVHMDPVDAVQAHLDLDARQSIGMHFGTFQLTAEGIDDPLRALEDAREARGVPVSQFRALKFGESFRLL
jgi:L-ascorbate metabolism protein UlaG (beta-lactamase superfamily)